MRVRCDWPSAGVAMGSPSRDMGITNEHVSYMCEWTLEPFCKFL